jgi:ATP-dependent Clp protease adaptor protein ClpS
METTPNHRPGDPAGRPALPPAPERPLLGAGTPAHGEPGGGGGDGDDAGVALEERTRVRKPRLYKVLLHNDDFTTMEFVVHVLVQYFKKSVAEATHVMLQVHHEGIGTAGVYTYEVAETKVAEVTAEARREGMPLKMTVEPS